MASIKEKDFLETIVMNDKNKATAKKLRWSDPDPNISTPVSDDSAAPEQAAKEQDSTSEKTLDRWFLEQRGKKRVPKLLKVANELLVTTAGPLKLTGNITLINEDGSVTHSNSMTLCRCGASNNKPFCDDQHLDVDFFDNATISRFSDRMPIKRPQTITVTCVKYGPLKFSGYLRVYNTKNQEYITMGGLLCRCGKSSNKPFCDNRPGCSDC